MPFIADGGLFVPSTKDYNLADEIYFPVKLADDSDKLPIAGKVVWITPAGATGSRQQGVGVQFTGENKDSIRDLIETHLTGQLNSKKPTDTM
jgi:type IV pilus assembly protein PilZ